MSLKVKIDADIKAAMLAKEKEKLLALRSIKALILLAETEKGTEINEEKEMEILLKAAKQRKDAAEIFLQQNRPELHEKEIGELKVIEAYLPKQLSEEEVKEAVAAIIAKVGASSPADLGKVMGAANAELKGKAEGKLISTVAKELLSK